MSSKVKHSISILDETYTILSDEGEQAVEQLALRVDELMRSIATATTTLEKLSSIDVKRAAIFAALHFANELKRLESKMDEQKIQESHLIDYINKELSLL